MDFNELWKTADELRDEHVLIYDSEEIKGVLSYVDAKKVTTLFDGPEDVTGAIVKVGDAELSEVWLTDSTRPFDVTARYFRVL